MRRKVKIRVVGLIGMSIRRSFSREFKKEIDGILNKARKYYKKRIYYK